MFMLKSTHRDIITGKNIAHRDMIRSKNDIIDELQEDVATEKERVITANREKGTIKAALTRTTTKLEKIELELSATKDKYLKMEEEFDEKVKKEKNRAQKYYERNRRAIVEIRELVPNKFTKDIISKTVDILDS